MVSGLVDAVCYLGLGHVFTANMTGNVVVLGFAAAGAAGFSVTATLTSLALFLAGALCAGWAGNPADQGQRQPAPAAADGHVGRGGADRCCGPDRRADSRGGVWLGPLRPDRAAGLRDGRTQRDGPPPGRARHDHHGAHYDADRPGRGFDLRRRGNQAAASTNARDKQAEYRRIAAVVAMLLGALAGALSYLHTGAGLPLFIALLAVSVAGVAFLRSKGS